jgi:hypothetical protein
VRHRELLATIIGQGTGFAVNNGMSDIYPLNPSDPSAFKWLSTIATSYDTYNLLFCKLEYVPLCSTAFVGRVALFYDRDSQDTGPFDRNELSNYASLIETAPWSPATLMLPDLRGERFMKDVSGSDDARVTDAGRIGWATYNTGTNDIDGDLFITYEVELCNAQPASSGISLVKGVVGALTNITQSGPRLVLAAVFLQAATSTVTIRCVTGTFFIGFIGEATGGSISSTNILISGDASFSGNAFIVSNTTRAASNGIITIRDTKASVQFTIAGGTVTNWQCVVARASAGQLYF